MGLLLGGGMRGASADIIYDGSGNLTDCILYTSNNPNASFGDDLTLDTGHGELVIRQVAFGFAVPANTSVPDCEALITFYDTEDIVAVDSIPTLTRPLGSFRVQVGAFDADPAARLLSFAPFDITGVIAGGIQMPDGSGGVSISFVTAGSNPPAILPGATITPALNAGPDCVGAGVVTIGSNHTSYFYLDGFAESPEDLMFTGAERVGFGGQFATSNFLWIQLGNAIGDRCAGLIRGDSNGDGQVNNFDIDAFSLALGGGGCTDNACRCHNDINRDGRVDNFDIDPFVQCLVAGCNP